MNTVHRPLGARLHALVVGATVAGLLGIYIWTAASLSRQHQELVGLAASERMSQLEDAASHVGEDFQDVEDDLEFALNLVDRSPDEASVNRNLGALLASVRRYRIAYRYDSACQGQIVRDPRWSLPEPPELIQVLEQTASEACRERRAGLVVSRAVGERELGTLRVFARTSPAGSGVALMVDTAPSFDRVRSLTADPSAEMLILGPHGSPTALSTDRLARAVERTDAPSFGALASAMRQGRRGIVVIPGAEARRMGYPDADLLVVFLPIRASEGSPGWSAATAISTVGIRQHERELAVRLVGAALAGSAVLTLLMAYVLRVARTEAIAAEQLKTADQVAHLRYRAERILDHIPSGVVALAPHGAVTATNVAARQWAPPSSPEARTLWELLPAATPTVVEHLCGLVERAIATAEVQQIIAQRLSLFGEEGTYTVLAVPVLPPSPEVGALLVVHDLTPVHDLQEQLLRAEKLATVGILAAGIAHEVGTPLGVIRGRAELVARKLGTDHPYRSSLEVIVDQIDRIARTIRALLDFATPRPVVPGQVAILPVYERVCDLVRYEAEKRRVSLISSVSPEIPAVRGDPDQLQQVLLNLVMNALDATPEGGRILMSADPDGDDGCVSIQVRDSGHGIPPRDLHRVFDPFFTTKKRGQGTGLGLTIVNQIAGAHGGVVRIDSTVGQGTTVEVLLPAAGGRRDRAQQGVGGR